MGRDMRLTDVSGKVIKAILARWHASAQAATHQLNDSENSINR